MEISFQKPSNHMFLDRDNKTKLVPASFAYLLELVLEKWILAWKEW